jgi:hypothetical protein
MLIIFGRGYVMKDLLGNEINLGPVTIEESNLLTTLTRMVNAKNILEFGYQTGISARAFLNGMKAGRLISLDIEDRSEHKILDDRLTLIKADMTEFNTDILSEELDIVFFDASHICGDNIDAYNRISFHLAPECLIIVHDTGYWDTSKYTDLPFELKNTDGIVSHRREELNFVHYLRTQGYEAINLGTHTEFRCGLTILQ